MQRFRRQQPVRHRFRQYRTVRCCSFLLVRPDSSDQFQFSITEVITSLPLEFTTDFTLTEAMHACFPRMLDSAAARLAPPMWNVRWSAVYPVPADGLCAITPIASPLLMMWPRAVTTVAVRIPRKNRCHKIQQERTLTASTGSLPAVTPLFDAAACCAERGYQQYPASERLQRLRPRSRSGSLTSPPSITGVIADAFMGTTNRLRYTGPAPSTDEQSPGNRVRSFFQCGIRQTFTFFKWVEMKYWSTFRPSRKFAVIGVSMMEPSGFAIRPRIPAS